MNKEIKEIFDNGVNIFGEILSKEKVGGIYQKFINARKFGSNLFQSEEDYTQQNSHLKTNPTPTFNFLNQFTSDLRFVEENPNIKDTITQLLGDDYVIVDKKLVCGVPDSWVPQWVKAKIDGVNIACLGPFIKKKYRDITYFRGIDFHQDIIDWPKGSTDLEPSTFLTLYVYIHDVDTYDSPLHIIPKSHKLGATMFPHKLEKSSGNNWIYEDDDGNKIECEALVLTGKAGYVGLWHNCTLHGTQRVKHESEKFRISLRYLIGKSNTNLQNTMIDEINFTIGGNLQPEKTRLDIDSLGKAIMKGNIINQ